MGSQLKEERMLRATLCEVERGLFHVLYRTEGKGLGQHLLPRYEVGACESDARLRVEQRARECGYSVVVWDTASPDLQMRVPPVGQDAHLTH
jgi:hypothetical protein